MNEFPSDADSAREYARRPAGSWFDDYDERPLETRGTEPIAVVEWEVPIDDTSTARHDLGAFRRDEQTDLDGERQRCAA